MSIAWMKVSTSIVYCLDEGEYASCLDEGEYAVFLLPV